MGMALKKLFSGLVKPTRRVGSYEVPPSLKNVVVNLPDKYVSKFGVFEVIPNRFTADALPDAEPQPLEVRPADVIGVAEVYEDWSGRTRYWQTDLGHLVPLSSFADTDGDYVAWDRSLGALVYYEK